MVAVVVDGRYKNLPLGSIHKVEYVNRVSVKLADYDRELIPSVCVYVSDEGKRLTNSMAQQISAMKKKGIKHG